MLHFTCQHVLDYLTEYLEGNLPPDEQTRLGEHLAACPPCLAYLRNLQSTIELTRHACKDDPALAPVPEELVRAILAAREQS